MKKIIFIPALILCAASAFAAESEVTTGHSIKHSFHLFTANCHRDESDAADSAPQSPPLEVDDPGTPGCNRWEINVVANGDMTKDQKEYELPLLDVNYGIGDNLQLKYEVPYTNSQSPEAKKSEIGDSKVGVKYRFFENEEQEIELGFYPQVALIKPTSDGEGPRKLQTMTTLPLLFAKPVGKTKLGSVDMTANVAYTLSGKVDTRDYLSASIGLGTPISNRFSVMGEIATEQTLTSDSEGFRDSIIKANLGVLTVISRKFMLFGSVGHSLYSADQVGHQYAVIGFRVLAGGSSPGPVVAANP